MSKPKRQHTIPCLHLKYFRGDNPKGQVWTYDAMSGRQWSATAENTSVAGNFYSGERPDGTMGTSIEEHLSLIESAAAPVYEALLRCEIPADHSQDKMNFAHFLGLMYVRTTSMRRMATESYGRFMQIMLYATAAHPAAFETSMRRYEQERGELFDAEERAELRRAMMTGLADYEFSVPQERTFTVLGAADIIAPILSGMIWSVMIARDGYFITSDNPLVRVVSPTSVSPIYGDGGFLNPTAEMTFPLSPSKLLYISRNTAARRVVLAPPYLDMANMNRAGASEQYLFADRKDAAVARLAQQFRDTRSSTTTSGYGPKQFGPIKAQRRRSKE
jgi:Protein of unknown function (DUF4238)